MTPSEDGLFSACIARGVSRRTFLKFSAAMAAALAIPASYAPRIAAALTAAPRIPIIWLRGQGCGGDGDALLRAAKPSLTELFIEHASIDYSEALMAPAGAAADLALTETLEQFAGRYFAVVEGAIPLADDGTYGISGGRPIRDIVREVCDGALATIAVGSCAFDGGLSAAAGGQTGAVGVGSVVGTDRLVNLPGCPVNPENLTATIVHYLTFNELPARDMRGRPLFAYGGLVHNQCERRSHFEFGQFVLAWGDEAAQKGWCLYKMGCKGPETFANCPTIRYGEGTSWAVKAGHGCIGCTMPAFWDAMSPFYQRLPGPLPFAPDVSVDQIGGAAVAGVAGLTVAHGVASYARQRVLGARAHRAATSSPVLEPVFEPLPEPIHEPLSEPVAPVQAVAAGMVIEPGEGPEDTELEPAPPFAADAADADEAEPVEDDTAIPTTAGEPEAVDQAPPGTEPR